MTKTISPIISPPLRARVERLDCFPVPTTRRVGAMRLVTEQGSQYLIAPRRGLKQQVV
jgi:hypothetical protein